jgi:hypothetical protein
MLPERVPAGFTVLSNTTLAHAHRNVAELARKRGAIKMFFQNKDDAIKPSLSNLLVLRRCVFRILLIQIQKFIAII